jgi:hypothetical protein
VRRDVPIAAPTVGLQCGHQRRIKFVHIRLRRRFAEPGSVQSWNRR